MRHSKSVWPSIAYGTDDCHETSPPGPTTDERPAWEIRTRPLSCSMSWTCSGSSARMRSGVRSALEAAAVMCHMPSGPRP